jgi:hypothetical protein
MDKDFKVSLLTDLLVTYLRENSAPTSAGYVPLCLSDTYGELHLRDIEGTIDIHDMARAAVNFLESLT